MQSRSLVRGVTLVITVVVVLTTNAVRLQAQERGRPAQGPEPPESVSEPQGFLAEPSLIERVVIFGDRHMSGGNLGSGFRWGFADLIPGAGWISGAAGYRMWGKRDQWVADGGAGISWRGYRAAEARFEMPQLARSRIALGTQFRWQDYTQIEYFGAGPDSLALNVSEYRLRANTLVGYATFRPVQWIDIGTQVGWLDPTLLPRGGSFMRDRPETSAVFADDRMFGVAEQPTFVTTEISMTADTRDFPGHPLRGGVVHMSATNYSDRPTGAASFRRYESEVAHFVPLADARVVLAVHGWLVGSDTDADQFVPFYMQPSLGGHNSLRSFDDYRFHDRNLLGVNFETRIAMMTHIDAAFFVDAGNVAPRVRDLNLDKRSFGAGLRLHSRRQTFARIDAARGSEGWRFVFRLTDPLLLSRLARKTVSVPFVP